MTNVNTVRLFIYVQLFIYLQILDALTTWVALHVGLVEGNQFVSKMIQLNGVIAGLLLSKLVGMGFFGIAFNIGPFKTGRLRAIGLGLGNYWYAAVVVWNLCQIGGRL